MVDGEEIRAHRCVLAALSPRYEAQFYGAMAENDTINVENISPAAFKEFLQFFYTDDVTLTLDNIEDVLNLVKQSLVDELITECVNFLMNVIGMDKLLWCYRLALAYDLKPVEKFCVWHIGVNIKSVLQSADFLSCDRDMLQHILNLDSLNCKETDVFDACISWAQAKCEQDGLDATDTTNLRIALGEALFKIRFCSMDTEEFAAINCSGLLTDKETIDVFRTIALKATGAQSSTFGADNIKMRKPIQLNLECSLVKGPRIPFNAFDNGSSIIFDTNKPIMLNGFVICNNISDSIKVTIGVAPNEDYYPKYTMLTSESETKIIFNKPFQIQAGQHCFIRMDSKAFEKSNSTLFVYDLERQTTQNGVLFRILRSIESNLFTRLLFHIDDKA